MAAGEERNCDFYGVMGLKKECTPAELRNAYKKLALKWHPDRCSASANQKFVEEAKKKFQDIQQAYSVLSDANKRFLYDVGIYNSDDDDDEDGMGDFLSEMAVMMNQNKPNERNESFEDLQVLFHEIFQSDTDVSDSSSRANTRASSSEASSTSNKRNCSEMSSRKFTTESTQLEGFCIRQAEHQQNADGETMARGSSRRDGQKQKVSTGHDVSSRGISA
ncbi:dnaJ homolog subfamily B member 3-like [Salvia splendens]|uniref:dnaJ homolog subfamily B member 3-like n=1 Tax=Salvia splendens TaxID=180675 RepID=UPI001C271E80|nr:dnaJ homolog subfamily B member 3-like [Salvia splendens]